MYANLQNTGKSSELDDRLQDICLTGVGPNGNDIGVGSYGRVFEVKYCGNIYAAKEVHSILVQGVRPEELEATKKAFLTECIRSSSLGHPNIVTFLGIYNPGGQSLLPVLVMERMQESLSTVVEKYPDMPMYVKLSMLLDVSQGLWYLHTHQPAIVHRDLSPNNVLLTSQFVAKISDLGVARVIHADCKKTKTRAPGTVDFMPPEALSSTPEYGPPLDIFSYGGVILHVINQKWPEPLHYVMTDPNTGGILGLSEVERRQQHLEMTGVPSDLRSLAEQCLNNQPSRRPLISDVSDKMKKMKELESVRCPHVNTDPITWQQVEQTTNMLRKATVSPPKPMLRQQSMFRKTVKWKELAPLPVGRSAHTAVLLDGNIYVGGGLEGKSINDKQSSYRLDVYNLTTNQWNPSPLATPYRHFAMTILDNKLLTVGGATSNNEVVNKVLFLNVGQWKEYCEMPTAKFNTTAVGYHSMLIVVGGIMNVEGKWLMASTTELLDTNSRCWYTCNNLPSPHKQLMPAIMDDKLYLLGGFKSDGKPFSQMLVASLENLSTHQLNWQSTVSTPWCGSAPVVQYKKFLLTVGGMQRSHTDEVRIFDQANAQWKHFTDIPAARSGLAVVNMANDIIVIGGLTNNNNEYSTSVWLGTLQ